LDIDPELEALGLEEFFPRTRPRDTQIGWEPTNVNLEEGGTATVYAPMDFGATPFAFCFTATDLNSDELVATSDVMVAWRNNEGAEGLAFASD